MNTNEIGEVVIALHTALGHGGVGGLGHELSLTTAVLVCVGLLLTA